MKGKENFFEAEQPVSKSQRRRDALEVKSLALELIKLKPARLAQVPMDDALRLAIDEAQHIRSNVARKRQMQYVAKLLRRSDPEPIVQKLEEFEGDARQLSARQHRTEAWRDYLLEAGDEAVGQLMLSRNDVDTQTLRQLLRNARKEAAAGKPPAAARSLFRLLRQLDETRALPATSTS